MKFYKLNLLYLNKIYFLFSFCHDYNIKDFDSFDKWSVNIMKEFLVYGSMDKMETYTNTIK
jgi:hypothetical protein